MNIIKELEADKCTCDAKLFYEKYKDKIKNFFDLKNRSPDEDGEFEGDDDYELFKRPLTTGSRSAQRHGSKKTKGHKESKLGKIRTRSKLGKSSSFQSDDGTSYSLEEQAEAERFNEVGMIREEEDMQELDGEDFVKPDSISGYENKIQQDGSQPYAPNEEIQATRGDDDETKYSASLKYYEHALDAKLDYLFAQPGEEESGEQMPCTRRYFKFDREEEKSTETLYKATFTMSALSASGEEEEYSMAQSPAMQLQPDERSDSQKQAELYLNSHKIYELFHFMGAHLTASNASNPIDYLITLLENCINYRSGFCEPPLLFEPKHIESLFTSMDPMRTGYIDINQYHTGMFTLGLGLYNKYPETASNGLVKKKVFIEEAFKQLKYHLDEMIASPLQPSSCSTSTYQRISVSGEGQA